MRLHQLKIDLAAEHDRLLLRISTNTGAEVLLWLTRRCVKRLWPALVDLAAGTPAIAVQPNPEARRALLGMRHEQAVAQADFSRPYQDTPRERPLGAEPILVARIQPGRDAQNRPLLGLLPSHGQGVTLTLDEPLLHGLMKLLRDAVAKTDWDLRLEVPAGLAPAPAIEGGRPTIN